MIFLLYLILLAATLISGLAVYGLFTASIGVIVAYFIGIAGAETFWLCVEYLAGALGCLVLFSTAAFFTLILDQ